jgi:hypothetical protein
VLYFPDLQDSKPLEPEVRANLSAGIPSLEKSAPCIGLKGLGKIKTKIKEPDYCSLTEQPPAFTKLSTRRFLYWVFYRKQVGRVSWLI